MSRQYNIRWGRSDYSKLSHLIRKVNKKRFEIEVKRPDISEYQPDYLDYDELKASIKTRRDFKNVINKYNRYLKDGVEEITKSDRGAVATKYAVNEFKIYQRAENARRRAEKKRLGDEPVTIAGVEQSSKRSQMGTTWEQSFKDSKKKFDNMGREEWEEAFKNFERKMYSSYRDEVKFNMIRNYVKGLVAEGYPDELINMMNHIDPSKFIKVFHTDEITTISFIYDPMELRAKADLLTEYWSRYVDENVNNGIDYYDINEEVKDEYANGTRIKGVGRVRYKKRRK